MDIPNKQEKQQLPSPRKLNLKTSFIAYMHLQVTEAANTQGRKTICTDGGLGTHTDNTHETWTFYRSHHHHKQLLSRI